MAMLNTVDTYMQLQPFQSVEELNQNTIEVRELFADQLTLSTKKVLDVLHRYACKYPGVCYLSKNKIAEMIGVTRRTVIRACKQLEDLGVIVQYELNRHNGDRRQSANAIVFVSVQVSDQTKKVDQENDNVTPECHTKDTLTKTQKSFNNTRDTEKADFVEKEVVKVSVVDKDVDNKTSLENIKRGMRDKMPTYIYDLLAPYFNLEDLYQAYGALLRGKAKVDKTMTFELYEGYYSDAIKSVILAYKRGIVKNLFAVLYTAAKDTTAQIYRKENYKIENWLLWD